jgi:hypothetical protein
LRRVYIMDDEKRNEVPNPRDGDGNDSHGDTQDPATGPRRGTPGEANPALAETEAYSEGTIKTSDFLRARGSAEAQLPGALEHRDKGFTGRPPHHGHPAPPVGGVTSDADLYDEEERHIMHEEPEMHVFAPRMLNIPSEVDEEKE